MNKINFKEVEKLFYNKYPNGEIFKDEGKISVVFDTKKSLKIYNYKYNNHADIINKLKLQKVIYTYNYNFKIKRIKYLQDALKRGYYKDDCGFGIMIIDKEQIKNEITELEKEIEGKIIL